VSSPLLADRTRELRREARGLLRLALPVAAGQLATMGMGLVDTVMLGRVSVEALAAASIANVWIWGTTMFASGVLFGLDPVVSQAHGARDGERAALALQRGLVLALALAVPLALLWTASERVLVLAGQDPELASAAHAYTRVQLPSAPCLLAFMALRQYLQGRELVRPAMWLLLLANAVNALLDWALIFGHWGAPALGLVGAGIATAATRILLLAGLAGAVWVFRLHDGAWVPWSRRALSPAGMRELLALGLPVAFQVCLEMWAFAGSTLLAGRLGAEALAAHTIALNLASIAFMVPLGVSQGAVVRVGNLIGARRPADAQRAAWVALVLGGGVMTVSAAGFLLFRHALPRVYTPDAGVVAAAAAILPIAAAFQVFDGTQVVGCGVLRGMGRTRPAALFNLVGYWLLALPVGGWLALATPAGLAGLWWGLCFGLALVASSLVAWIARRGPGRAVAARGAAGASGGS
jgi:MATE family multidrug resistance protein